jgi:hypothetical protein
MQPGLGKAVFRKQQDKVPAMRLVAKAILSVALLAVSLSPAMARRTYVDGAVSASPMDYPGAPKPPRDNPASPYPMNYSDEAAQAIGVRDGHMDVFSTKPAENRSYLPSFSGGLGRDGAMLKLQWHPGE